MNNSTKLFFAASLFIMASCGETKVEETQTTVAPATTETIVVETEPAKPAKTTVTKSTEIVIGPDGSKIESKDGKSETKVELSKDKAGVTIKR